MRIIFIGDVVGSAGCEALETELSSIKREYGADIVIVNGENSAEENGIDPRSAQRIFDSGADVITTGNHVFRKRSINELLETSERIIRPANYGEDAPGRGLCELDLGAYRIAVPDVVIKASLYQRQTAARCVPAAQYHSSIVRKSRIFLCLIPFRLRSSSSIETTYLGKLSRIVP